MAKYLLTASSLTTEFCGEFDKQSDAKMFAEMCKGQGLVVELKEVAEQAPTQRKPNLRLVE